MDFTNVRGPVTGSGLSEGIDSLEVVVDPGEAESMREHLRPWLSAGVRISERRHWLLWWRFVVTGPAQVLHRIDSAVVDWGKRRWEEREGF